MSGKEKPSQVPQRPKLDIDFAAFEEYVKSIGRRLGCSVEDQEDLVSEAWLIVDKVLPRCDPGKNPAGYIYICVAHGLTAYLRGRRKRECVETELKDDAFFLQHPSLNEMGMIQTIHYETLLAKLSKMKGKMFAAAVLFYGCQLPSSEVQEMLNLDPNTFWVDIERFKRQARRSLQACI